MPDEYTLNTSRPPRILRLVNAAGKLLDRCGLAKGRFNEASIIQAAMRRTGLTDLGDDSFREPLALLLEDYRSDTGLNWVGKVGLRSVCVDLIKNRLLLQQDWKSHPEILQTPIRRPIFVTGLPRTGTTLLYNLLAQDPASRSMMAWEGVQPVPVPKDEARGKDRRLFRTRLLLGLFNYFAPKARLIHATEATGPEEGTSLIANTLVSAHLVNPYMPRYRDWLLSRTTQTTVPAWRHYRQQLQTLAWRRNGSHWAIKCSAFLYALDALFAVFPDAHVIHNHRDVCEAVPSLCSLYATVLKVAYPQLDLGRLGRFTVDFWSRILERARQARTTIDPTAVYDLAYADLVRDPLGSVRRIYERFGYEVTDVFEQRMRDWLAHNPQHKFGRHRYGLEQFGLTEAAVRQAFAPYDGRLEERVCQPVSSGQETLS